MQKRMIEPTARIGKMMRPARCEFSMIVDIEWRPTKHETTDSGYPKSHPYLTHTHTYPKCEILTRSKKRRLCLRRQRSASHFFASQLVEMGSYEDDGYSTGATSDTGNGDSFGANAMGKASDFTIPLISWMLRFLSDSVETAQIMIDQSPILKGVINIFMVLSFVYCVLALFFPRRLRAVVRAMKTLA